MISTLFGYSTAQSNPIVEIETITNEGRLDSIKSSPDQVRQYLVQRSSVIESIVRLKIFDPTPRDPRDRLLSEHEFLHFKDEKGRYHYHIKGSTFAGPSIGPLPVDLALVLIKNFKQGADKFGELLDNELNVLRQAPQQNSQLHSLELKGV